MSEPEPVTPAGAMEVDEGEMKRKAKELLEFYFGDSNLLKDRFLRHKIENSDGGWVPLSVLATFKKLRALTDGDLDSIRESARLSEELKISKDGTTVARVRSLPKLDADDSHMRTVYVEGLTSDVTIEDVQQLVTPWGSTSYIRSCAYFT
jgi:hypothetical protein